MNKFRMSPFLKLDWAEADKRYTLARPSIFIINRSNKNCYLFAVCEDLESSVDWNILLPHQLGAAIGKT